jgi:hypothetical protein
LQYLYRRDRKLYLEVEDKCNIRRNFATTFVELYKGCRHTDSLSKKKEWDVLKEDACLWEQEDSVADRIASNQYLEEDDEEESEGKDSKPVDWEAFQRDIDNFAELEELN